MNLYLAITYLYRGIERQAYGFESPNVAAALIAGVIPFLWISDYRKEPVSALRWGTCTTLEIGAYMMLALTFSRAGVLACFIALGCYGALIMSACEEKARLVTYVKLIGFRAVLLTVICLSVGVVSRFADITTGDRSVSNRLSLWSGGLTLIGSEPFRGWGKGESGAAYMQWVQSPDSTSFHGGMTNSYLHIAVEHGVPVFFGCLFVACFPVVVGVLLTRNRLAKGPQIAAVCGTVSLLVSNVFSTLWIDASIITLFVILSAVCVFWPTVKFATPKILFPKTKAILPCLCISICGACLVLLLSYIFAASSPWHLRRVNGGGVLLSRSSDDFPVNAIRIYADLRSLGPLYGRELRAALSRTPSIKSVIVFPPEADADEESLGGQIFLGARVVPHLSVVRETVVVCPTEEPIGMQPNSGLRLIVLPDYDETGVASHWARFAEANDIPVVRLDASGQDIRHYAPFILSAAAKHLAKNL